MKKQIEISLTDEGLRIELVESAKGTFFEVGSPRPTPMLADILKILAEQLKGIPNHISIEGYTDAQPYVDGATYGNWELSTDRANVARRVMQNDGLRLDQVSQVRGFGDQRLHVPDKPFDAGNRRVSLVVQNLGTDLKDLGKPKDAPQDSIAAVKPGDASPATLGQPATAESVPKPTAVVLPIAPTAATGILARAKGLFAHK